MTTNPVLFYFPFAGRGELTKLIAAAGGVQLDMGELPENRAEICAAHGCVGTGIPILTHGDMKISQSQAIQNYIALIAPRFSGLTPQERAVDMMWCAHFEDFIGDAGKSGIFECLFGGKEVSEEVAGKLKEATDKWMGHLERLAPADGFINQKPFPTAADCAVVTIFEAHAPWAVFRAKSGASLDGYPKLKGLVDRALAADGLKEYVAATTSLKANPFG